MGLLQEKHQLRPNKSDNSLLSLSRPPNKRKKFFPRRKYRPSATHTMSTSLKRNTLIFADSAYEAIVRLKTTVATTDVQNAEATATLQRNAKMSTRIYRHALHAMLKDTNI